jgi:hypothetical protein
LVPRLLATTALWVQIQISLKNKKNGRHKQRSVATHSSPAKKYTQKNPMITLFVALRPCSGGFGPAKGFQKATFKFGIIYSTNIL